MNRRKNVKYSRRTSACGAAERSGLEIRQDTPFRALPLFMDKSLNALQAVNDVKPRHEAVGPSFREEALNPIDGDIFLRRGRHLCLPEPVVVDPVHGKPRHDAFLKRVAITLAT